jgi:hypothetical protein
MDQDNDDWRSHWTLERVSRIAVHQSGVTARVAASPNDSSKDHISFENTASVDLFLWDPGELTEQAIVLWMERKF